MRLFRVWLIFKLWRVMPRRAKLWAFLNDDLSDDPDDGDDSNPLVLPGE